MNTSFAGSQIRKQEAECAEAIEMAFAPEPPTRLGAKSTMNTQAFPLEFLQKSFLSWRRLNRPPSTPRGLVVDRYTLTLPFCRRHRD
jgi:hypothetical protein